MDFEQFANADYTILDNLGSVNGFTFTGFAPALRRSIRSYNYPLYVTQATGGAWFDFFRYVREDHVLERPGSSFSAASIGTTATLNASISRQLLDGWRIG